MKKRTQYKIVVILIVALAATTVLVTHSKVENRNQRTNLDSSKAIAEKAIANSQQYLESNYDQVSSFSKLTLDYLYRKYSLRPLFDASNNSITFSSTSDEMGLAEFNALKRIAYPDQIVSDLSLAGTGAVSQMMMMAANCDHIPLPDNFENLLHQNIKTGRYHLTHAVFSQKLMNENDCKLSSGNDKKIFDEAIEGLESIIADPASTPDLRYEAMAFLTYSDKQGLITNQQFTELMNEQQTDGGWGISGGTISDEHSTVLALWVLLGYARQNDVHEPMIRH